MEKNTAGKWTVFAYGDPNHATLAGLPITGDAANITANIRIDGGAANAVDDTNPTELEDGYYVFDITAAEANGDLISMHPASATANVLVIGVPGAIYTRPANFNDLSITATTGRTDVASIAGTAQTANDNGADINTLLTRIVGTLAAGTHNPASAAQIAVLSDWIDGGRLDLILDIIAADTTTDIPALIATAQADLDIITGADGATLATAQPSITFQPLTITAGDAINNITLAGSGSSDGIAFTRSGSGDPFDANFMAQINAEVDTALTDYAPATEAKQDIIDTNVDNLGLGIIYGSAVTGTLSTTQATSDLTGYADDQLIGRVIIWTSGACEGEGSVVSDYANAGGLLTFTALTTAPANTDTFKIV